MSEIEVKVLNIDVDDMREKLKSLGGKLVKNEYQVNYMYDFPDNSLENNYRGYCRIRQVDNLIDGTTKYILGVKKMISQVGFKEMEEHETEVSNILETQKILEELGLYNKYKPARSKHRESYELDDSLYEIDILDKEIYPNPYLEIEAKDKEALIKAIEKIGYKLEDTTSKTLKELREDLGIDTD